MPRFMDALEFESTLGISLSTIPSHFLSQSEKSASLNRGQVGGPRGKPRLWRQIGGSLLRVISCTWLGKL